MKGITMKRVSLRNSFRLWFHWHFRKIVWAVNGTLWRKRAFEQAFIDGYMARGRMNVKKAAKDKTLAQGEDS